MLTLWRGTQLLGSVHERQAESPDQRMGIVVPDSADTPLPSLWQHRVTILGTEWVLQHPLEPDTTESRARRPATKRPGPVALRELAPGESPGVPFEEQLRLEDELGPLRSTGLILLQEIELTEQTPASERAWIPREAVRGDRVWVLHAHGTASNRPP